MPDGKKSSGPCYVCQSDIHILNFECGHIVSYADGGSLTVDNLLPICGSCNKSMGKRNLYEYKREFFPKPKEKKIHEPVTSPKRPISMKPSPKQEDIDLITISMESLSIRMPKVPTLRPEKPRTCQHIIRQGKRKGQLCGGAVKDFVGEKIYCRTHLSDHYMESQLL